MIIRLKLSLEYALSVSSDVWHDEGFDIKKHKFREGSINVLFKCNKLRAINQKIQ